MEKISDFDPRIVYLPNDAAPQDCADNADDEACDSRWWTHDSSSPISLHSTWGPNTSCEFSFTGHAVQMYGTTSSTGAVAHASVDRQSAVIVNFASGDGDTHNNQLLLNITGLDAGQHIFKLWYDKASYGSAPGRKTLNIDWFEVGPNISENSPTTHSAEPTATSSRSQKTVTEFSSVLVTRIIMPDSVSASHSLTTKSPVPIESEPIVSEPFSGLGTSSLTSLVLPPTQSPAALATSDHSFLKTVIPSVVAPAVLGMVLLVLLGCHWRRCRIRRRTLAEAEAARAETIRPYTVAMCTGSPNPSRVQSKINSLRHMSSSPYLGQPAAVRNSVDSGQTKVEN